MLKTNQKEFISQDFSQYFGDRVSTDISADSVNRHPTEGCTNYTRSFSLKESHCQVSFSAHLTIAHYDRHLSKFDHCYSPLYLTGLRVGP